MTNPDEGGVSPEDRETLLDHFPVNEAELDRLMNIVSKLESGDLGAVLREHASLGNSAHLDRLMVYLPRLVQWTIGNVFVVGSFHEGLAKPAAQLEAVATLLGRRNESLLLQAIYEAAAPEPLANWVCSVVWSSQVFQQPESIELNDPPATPPSWSKALAEIQSASAWRTWVEHSATGLRLAVATTMHHVFLGTDFVPRPIPFKSLDTDKPTSFWKHPSELLPTSLALAGLGTNPWKRLYSSDDDGLAFASMMERGLMGFHGPTVILVQTGAEVFGYYTTVPYKQTGWHTGVPGDESDSFLFAMEPAWSIYRATGSCKWHQFLKVQPRGLSGLAIGGLSADTPRVHIASSLEDCRAGAFDLSFEQGPLHSRGMEPFAVDAIEVWAVPRSKEEYRRGARASLNQAAVRDSLQKRVAHVDKKQFLHDFQSGAILNHMYDHRDQARGRADFVAADDERGGYYVEGKPPTPSSG